MLNFLSKWKKPPVPTPRAEVPPAVSAASKVAPEPTLIAPAKIARHLNQFGENIEAHGSALFAAPVIEVTFYDGQRIRIPQQSTPDGWVPQF